MSPAKGCFADFDFITLGRMADKHVAIAHAEDDVLADTEFACIFIQGESGLGVVVGALAGRFCIGSVAGASGGGLGFHDGSSSSNEPAFPPTGKIAKPASGQIVPDMKRAGEGMSQPDG
jgi:hypothetical protein